MENNRVSCNCNCNYLYDKRKKTRNLLTQSRQIVKNLSFEEYQNAFVMPMILESKGKIPGGLFDKSGHFISATNFSYDCKVSDAKNIQELNFDVADERVIFLGMFIDIWGHLIIDGLQRMWFLFSEEFKQNFSDCKLVYIPASFNKKPDFKCNEMPENFRRLLEIIGIDTDKLVPITKITQFSSVILPDSCIANKKGIGLCFTEEYRMLLERIRLFQKQKFVLNSHYEKVFYTHRNYKENRDKGEEKLEEFFKELGYTVLSPEKYSFDEQLNILANCRYFASTIGSCSHNTVFLPEDSKIYLIPREYSINQYQAMISQLFKQNVTYIDSSLSLLAYYDYPWAGPFYFFISDNLLKAFGKYNNNTRKTVRNSLMDIDEYLGAPLKFKDFKKYTIPFTYMRMIVKYLDLKKFFRYFLPMLFWKISYKVFRKFKLIICRRYARQIKTLKACFHAK